MDNELYSISLIAHSTAAAAVTVVTSAGPSVHVGMRGPYGGSGTPAIPAALLLLTVGAFTLHYNFSIRLNINRLK